MGNWDGSLWANRGDLGWCGACSGGPCSKDDGSNSANFAGMDMGSGSSLSPTPSTNSNSHNNVHNDNAMHDMQAGMAPSSDPQGNTFTPPMQNAGGNMAPSSDPAHGNTFTPPMHNAGGSMAPSSDPHGNTFAGMDSSGMNMGKMTQQKGTSTTIIPSTLFLASCDLIFTTMTSTPVLFLLIILTIDIYYNSFFPFSLNHLFLFYLSIQVLVA